MIFDDRDAMTPREVADLLRERGTGGLLLKAIRHHREESLERAALGFGIAAERLAAIESGGEHPSREEVLAIARYYGRDPDVLLRTFGLHDDEQDIRIHAALGQVLDAKDALRARLGRPEWLRGIGVGQDSEGHFVKVNVARIASKAPGKEQRALTVGDRLMLASPPSSRWPWRYEVVSFDRELFTVKAIPRDPEQRKDLFYDTRWSGVSETGFFQFRHEDGSPIFVPDEAVIERAREQVIANTPPLDDVRYRVELVGDVEAFEDDFAIAASSDP